MFDNVRRFAALQRGLHNSQVRSAAIRGNVLADQLEFPQGFLAALGIVAPFWAAVGLLIHHFVR